MFYVIGSKLIFYVVLEVKEMLRRHFREWKIIVLADFVDMCAFTICNIEMDIWQYYVSKRERIMYRDMFLIINVMLALFKIPN